MSLKKYNILEMYPLTLDKILTMNINNSILITDEKYIENLKNNNMINNLREEIDILNDQIINLENKLKHLNYIAIENVRYNK